MKKKSTYTNGVILINALIFAGIAITVTIGLTNWGATVLKTTRTLSAREQAFQLAEAGIEYYRWHLAHAATDYTDGTGGQPGPYLHNVTDADGDVIGRYELTITPPPIGSTIVKVKSKGVLASDETITRSIQATLAIPSLAKFAVVANNDMRFGAGTEIFGPVHSNGGVRFDGVSHNLVTSSKTTYDDPDDGNSQQKFAVYTTVNPIDPNPPAAVPSRPDVFIAGRQFPVQSFDFAGLTFDLAQMKADAQANGRYIAASGAQGYRILLKDNDTFDLYRVNSLRSAPSGCTNSANQTGWGTWSVNSQTLISSSQTFPANGIIFVEDHIWVEGEIDGARLTIAAGRFPDNAATRRSITVNKNLLYNSYDGTDVLALIAQDNIHVGLVSDNVFRIDAALIAQNGRVGRYYYDNDCRLDGTNYYDRNTITLFGMIATNQRYGFAYTNGTGYDIRNITYDTNLLYGPPPSFPLTSSQYQTISWQEVQ
jgi:hypothetical protein